MAKKLKVRWADEPEPHDYKAAESYLSLLVAAAVAKRIAARLRQAPMTEFKAKDIFRASGLPLLPLQNAHVKQDEKRIIAREKLSPILLVRDPGHGRLLVADGYHRMCAVYAFNEDVVVPCKIV